MTRLTGNGGSTKSPFGNLDKNAEQRDSLTDTPKLWLLDVRNSTLRMTSWILDVQEFGYSACLLSSSDMTIEGSEIVSNMECSPFVVTGDLDGYGCQIQITRSSHKSTLNAVLPLVTTSPNQREIDIEMQMKNDRLADHESRQLLSISGVDLSMKTQHFPLGTGPLFTFHSHHAFDSVIQVGTNLVESYLVNISSSSAFSPGKHLFGSEVSQRVVGSCVAQSTNHDSGTGMMSPNLGGNLLCLNTSFSSCIRSRNTPLDFSFENRTQTHLGRFAITSSSDVTSVSFTLCTFNEMTVASADGSHGAAIYLNQASSFLTVRTCFFHKCTCTASSGDGGAVFFWGDVSSKQPFSVSDSSFTECSAGHAGGSILVNFASSISIDCCCFEQSTANTDGAAYLLSDLITISGTAFVQCSATSRSGAVLIDTVTALSLTSSQFRDCTNANDPNGKDVYFYYNASSQITSGMITFCDSTSGAPNVYFRGDSTADSTRVPFISSTPTIKSADVSFDGNYATVTVETSQAIKGTMGVLLDGSNVPRLVHVVFGNDTTTSRFGTAVVSSGTNGILPSATYTNRTTSFASNFFPLPTVLTADSTLKDWNTTEIVLKGVRLEEGSYWMLVEKGENEWNITLTHSDSTTLIGKATLYPSTAEDRLEWSTEYDVTKVMWDGGEEPDQDIALPDTLTFTTPAEPARITSVDCALNGKKDVVIVELTGTTLTSDGQTLAVVSRTSNEMMSSGELFNVTSTKCFVNFSIGSSESSTDVVFGGKYDLKSFESESSSAAVNSGLFFEVPHPPRITSFDAPSEVSTSTFVLAVSGENLPSGKTFTVTLTSGHSFDVSFSSPSAGTSTIGIGGSGQLQYNTNYTLKSVMRTKSEKDDEHILLSASSFKTPLGPTLSSVSCKLSLSDPNTLNLTLSTQRMPPEDFTLTLKSFPSSSEPVSLLLASSDLSAGFVLVEVYNKTDTLLYGKHYSIDGMTSSSVVVVVAALPFSTPSEPIRITSASCSLGDDKQKSAVVTLNGVKLGGGKAFSVGVRKMEGSSLIGDEIELHGTLSGESSSTTHTLSVLIFGNPNPLLSFGTKYAITRFDVDDSVCVANATVTFSVPAESARIVGLETRQLNNNRTKMIVLMEGRALLSRTGKVSLSNGSTRWESLSDVDILNDTHCTAEFAVGEEETSDELKYGEEYTLKGSWTESSGFIVEDGIAVKVPFPPKITEFEIVLVEGRRGSCFVRLTGTDLEQGTNCELTLNPIVTLHVTFTSTTEGRSNEVSIGKNGIVKYSSTYTIASLEPTNAEDGSILFDPSLSFTTGDSTIVEVIVSEGGSNRTEECGSFSTPCSSIAIGWKTGTEEEGLNEVILLIHKSARFGSQVHVGRKTLEMRSLFEEEGRVDVEEGAGWGGKEEGVVVVAGGSLQMMELTLRLPRPSLVGETKTASVVVSGFGECVLDGVRVVERWEGEGVGMGMVLWSGGSLRLTKIEMKSVWMESNVTLVKCSSSSSEVRLEMSDCMFVEVETRNAELVAFSSTLASSRFEMDGCVFISTNRSETRGGERTGLIKISTGQERTEIRKCKFSDCGTLLSESGGRKKGGVLIVEIKRESVLDRKEVRILDCVVMNSSPLRESEGEEMSGGVVVWSSGKGVVVVDVGGSWFEETAFSKQELERDSLGMPIVSPKRKIVHSLSSDVPAGLVVGGGGCVPVIARRGSSFSGCSLRVERRQTETKTQQNSDDL